MIVASDLDRTLIYSNRAIEEFGVPANTKLKPVEKKDGKTIAFMTIASFNALKVLCDTLLFIPITTRTTEQFKRIFIFERDIALKYTITLNGATILKNGKPLEDWSNLISTKLIAESATGYEVLSCMRAEGIILKGNVRQVEGLFFYYILESAPSKLEINCIREFVSKFGWRISLQGRKLYFMPNGINKGDALEFICNQEEKKVIAGAGDSVLDLDFLKNCQNPFVPKHGELTKLAKKWIFTENQGILAGEEILQKFLDLSPLKI